MSRTGDNTQSTRNNLTGNRTQLPLEHDGVWMRVTQNKYGRRSTVPDLSTNQAELSSYAPQHSFVPSSPTSFHISHGTPNSNSPLNLGTISPPPMSMKITDPFSEGGMAILSRESGLAMPALARSQSDVNRPSYSAIVGSRQQSIASTKLPSASPSPSPSPSPLSSPSPFSRNKRFNSSNSQTYWVGSTSIIEASKKKSVELMRRKSVDGSTNHRGNSAVSSGQQHPMLSHTKFGSIHVNTTGGKRGGRTDF